MATKTVTIKRDPMKARRHIKRYEKQLKQLIENYRVIVLRAFEQSSQSRSLSERELGLNVNLDLLLKTIEEAALYSVLQPGSSIVFENVRSSYQQGTNYADSQLSKQGVTVTAGFQPTDWRMLDALRVRNLSALKGITDDMGKRIMQSVTDGVAKGEGMELIARRIRANVDVGKNRAMAMARVETMYASNQASIVRFGQQGVSHVIWQAGADDRCCDECLNNNGKIFSITNIPDIPAHVNCRCCLSPAPESDI